jgi:hypothetical protein
MPSPLRTVGDPQRREGEGVVIIFRKRLDRLLRNARKLLAKIDYAVYSAQRAGTMPRVDVQGPNPRLQPRRSHASLVSKRSSFPTPGAVNRNNRLPSALGAVQSPRILPRSGAIDGRDPSRSGGVPYRGNRMHDDDTPSPSFDSLRPGVTFRANNGHPPSFPLDCWQRCGT